MSAATLDPQFWWWVVRATGLVAWCVVTAGIVWGLTLSAKVVRRRKVPAWLLDLHRYLGTLAVIFVAVHIGALAADGFVHFGLRELFVPMASGWRPVAVTFGIVAFYLLLIVELTSLMMNRLPRRVWHAIHLSSFAVLGAGTVHGVLAGADRGETLVQFAALSGLTVVLTLAIFRVLNLADQGASRNAGLRAVRAASPPDTSAGTPEESAGSPARPDRTDAPVDPAIAERLARLGSRVGRSAAG
ncbi:MAG TPA: hypothetical protein VF441_03560 [Acidimicrobiia bacterium]